MNNFTFAQQRSIQTWTEQRDSLLREIGNLSVERDTLKTSLKEGGLALADLHTSIAEARGRLAELVAHEERQKGSVSIEVSELEVRKSRLQGECDVLQKTIEGADAAYEIISLATKDLQGAHDVMKDQAVIVNRVVGEIIQTSTLHTSDMKTIMAEIQTISAEVIEKSRKNIETADVTLNKLTMHIVDSQRPIPVRRIYPDGHPKAIKEETIKS